MTLETDWLTLGSTSVNIAALSTHDDYGNPSWAAASTYDCLVEFGRRLVTRSDGQQEVSTATLYVLSTAASVGLSDKLTLPGTTWTPRILAIEPVRDSDGQHHVEVMLG